MKKILFSLIIISFYSCQENTILEQNILHEVPTVDDQLYFIPDTSFFTFTYEGKTYVYGENKNDKNVVLRKSDQNGSTLYQELIRKKNLCTIVKEDGSLEIHNSLEEFMKINSTTNDLNIINKSDILPMAATSNPTYKGTLNVYDREFFIHMGYNTLGYNYLNCDFSFANKIHTYENQLFARQCIEPMFKIKSFTYSAESGDAYRRKMIHYLVFYDGYFFDGQTLVYEKDISYGSKFTIGESQLSRIGWADRVECLSVIIYVL